MCEHCSSDDITKLNLHCCNCGTDEVELVPNKFKLIKDEFGLTHKVQLYKCKHCQTEMIICNNCAGTGFINKSIDAKPDYADCEICYGMGLIKISDLNF